MQLKRMSNIHSIIFFFIFFTIFGFSSSSSIIHKCSEEQSHALLLFKQNVFSTNFSVDPGYYSPCQDWYGCDYNPILKNWNTNSDCCDWNGVTCDPSTGDVIGLDLSCGMLKGIIDSNSSLFHLPHLRKLNLAFNDFYGSRIPREIGILSNTLTHLNISECCFSGQLPSEISLLHKLVSLDLSSSHDHGFFNLESNVFNNLLQNATVLEELSLARVNISSAFPSNLNISSSLRLLNLPTTGLHGKLPPAIFTIQSLKNLDLSSNSFTGQIPSEILHFPKLVSLDLSSNTELVIQPHIFISLLGNSTFLRDLSFGNVSIGLVLPTYLKIPSPLESLDLSSTGLQGSLPKSLANLRYLIELDLSYNKLNGVLPSWLFSLPSLEYMYLYDNFFSGNVPLTSFSHQSLKVLSLGRNNLSGQIDVLDQGPNIVQTYRQLINLSSLDLSYNNFRGKWELDSLLSSLINLVDLDLSHSGLSVTSSNTKRYVNPEFRYLKLASCNIKVFPESIQPMKNLRYLDLSHNEIHGSIPDWAGEIAGYNFYHLDLSHNSISRLPQFQWDGLQCMYLQSNKIQGPFPLSICNMSYLFALDMSNNNFSGVIPKCFGNFLSSLTIINLRNNHFQGTIPNAYRSCEYLEGFILNGNQLEGEIPSFLSECRNLNVVDVGNNNLNGTFPHWLGQLPNLQVLVLKSNNFHGPILTRSTAELPFQRLQVLDLSHNGFVGQLPVKYFQNSKVMKNVVKENTEPRYVFVDGRHYSITIAIKGVMQNFPQIFVQNTIIDVSGNGFQGKIPNSIGSLNSLKALNLSHNHLDGRIPPSLGSLREIESLDLSWNKLIGEIPKDLLKINGLAVLNLSQNHLVGRIPQGTQFNTFDQSVFGGNSGLCGFPLPECELSYRQDKGHDDDKDAYTWKAVLLGYGCGTSIGLVLGYFMLSTGKPKWFNEISNSVEQMILKWRNKGKFQ